MKRRFLTDDEIKQFWTEGYVVIKGVLTPEEADAGRQAILDLLPRDLNFPKHIASHGGRVQPH
ncbi:MAG: hypothetical protein O3A46_16235, partial [Candidatus Poribacteria bacterium]|nr:hypothetical protein [Candidatus Poribacteria bacterium]